MPEAKCICSTVTRGFHRDPGPWHLTPCLMHSGEPNVGWAKKLRGLNHTVVMD